MRVLHSQKSTIVFCERMRVPRIVYFGERLHQPLDDSQLAVLLNQAIPQGSMDESPALNVAPSFSDPIFVNPAIRMHRNGTLWAPQWQLLENEASNHEVQYRLSDPKSGLIVLWRLTIDDQTNVFTVDVCLENKGSEAIGLEQWLTTLPLPQSMSQVMSFSGRWIHEFFPQTQTLEHGSLEFTNYRGRTSHDHFPGLITGEDNTTSTAGECYGFHLGWSGNHTQRVEKNQNGISQYQAGIALMPGEVILSPGDKYEAAPLYFTHSTTGFAGIGENFQPFVREHILKFPTDKPRPVHINTWEALYFNHDQSELDSLAAAAETVGAERYVLDDGWFLGRRDDTAGLGDWIVDESVYPQGLHPLKATLKKHNLGFGLWFEPEMVNKQSELYKKHPEWVLQIADQEQASGRNQWVLDITRAEVQDYLVEHICAILRDYPIEYIKWDMNRDLLQAGNAQGKPAYRDYVLSLYDILGRIRNDYPNVEIESCASGGGRMDYGILKYTHRFWLSDCNDANERQQMQQWASLFFPAEVLGSHVGPTVSHTTSRSHPLYVRAGTALFGHLGIEWDVREATDAETEQLKQLVNVYKDYRDVIHSGVRKPILGNDKNQIAFSIEHSSTNLFSIFQQTVPDSAVQSALKLENVKSDENYEVTLIIEPEHTAHLMKRKPVWMHNKTNQFSGEALKRIGLPLPVLDPESLLVFEVKKI